jgi:hypothetical protein
MKYYELLSVFQHFVMLNSKDPDPESDPDPMQWAKY